MTTPIEGLCKANKSHRGRNKKKTVARPIIMERQLPKTRGKCWQKLEEGAKCRLLRSHGIQLSNILFNMQAFNCWENLDQKSMNRFSNVLHTSRLSGTVHNYIIFIQLSVYHDSLPEKAFFEYKNKMEIHNVWLIYSVLVLSTDYNGSYSPPLPCEMGYFPKYGPSLCFPSPLLKYGIPGGTRNFPGGTLCLTYLSFHFF